MKKYCLLTISILCLFIIFSGCSNTPEQPDVHGPSDTTITASPETLRPIDEIFMKTFNIENINDYVLQDVYAGTDFVIYEAYKKDVEKTEVVFGTGDLRFIKASSGEFDRFDYLLFKDDNLTSLINELEMHTFNYYFVDELFEKHKTPNIPVINDNPDVDWVEGKIYNMINLGIITEEVVSTPTSAAAYLYNLNNWDYEWVIFYSDNNRLHINDFIFIKYETEEQKENLIKSIQYRIDKFKDETKFEAFKDFIDKNQRLYFYDNILIWFNAVNYPSNADEIISDLFRECEIGVGLIK